MIPGRASILIVVIVALTSVIVWSVWRNLTVYLHNDHLVVQSKQQLWDLQRLRTTLEEAETGQRGYLLRQKPEYLAPYEQAAGQVESRLSAVDASCEPGQREQFEALSRDIAARVRIIRQTIELASRGDVAAAIAIVETDQGQKLMSSIRSQLDSMQAGALERFTVRLDNCKHSTRVMTWTVWVCALALVLMSVSAIVILSRTNSQLLKLNTEVTEANRLRDGFLAVLSHELRSPLTPALLTASALEHEAEPGSERRESLALVRQSIELETRLIDDLLDISRARNGKLRLDLKPIRLHEPLNVVIDLCRKTAQEAGVKIVSRLQGQDQVSGDASRLQQVFLNVLGNAIKFTPAGGTVTVESASVDNNVVVTVSDTGCGIDPGKLDKIFKPFEQVDPKITRKTGGLGLGLAIAQQILSLHGGSISAESAGAGRGSTFTIALPRA